MTPEFQYVPLPGSYRGFFRKASLWEGIDHVLSISGTRFNESYRRFYYRDIQAICIENRARLGSLGWWGVLWILFIVALISTIANDPPHAGYALAVGSILLLIRSYVTLGQGCQLFIQTAVSREAIPAVLRRREAQQVMERLQLRIAAEQGTLPDEIPAADENVMALVQPPDPAQASATQMLEEADSRERERAGTQGVNWAVAAFLFLLLNGGFTVWLTLSKTQLLSPLVRSWIGYVFIGVGLLAVYFALRNLALLRVAKPLCAVLATTAVFDVVRTFVGLSFVLFSPQLAGGRMRTGGALPAFWRYYGNINGGLQLALAAAGLLLVFAKWTTYRRGGPSIS